MTPKLERILIAVDETPSSQTALEQGLALAAGDDADVVFVHVVSIVGEQFVPGDHKPDRVPDRARLARGPRAPRVCASVRGPATR